MTTTTFDETPFDQVYTALWSLVEGRAAFDSLVKVGNRVRFDDLKTRNPLKEQIITNDLPELLLTTSGGTFNVHATSSSASCTRRYQWVLSTGDRRLRAGLLAVEWELFRAMVDWKSQLGSLQFSGQNFVKSCELVDLTEGESDPDRNRGIEGWSAVWAADVTMYFALTSLKGV